MKVTKVNNYENWLVEREILSLLIRHLHEGCTMLPLSDILNEGTMSKADYELDRLLKRSEAKGEAPLVKDFVPEIKSLVQKFADSGQSGASAPYTSGVIVSVIQKLLNQEPLGGIEGTEDEWVDIGKEAGETPGTMFQNNRLSSVFKDADDKPYYLDAIVFKDTDKDWSFTSGSIDLPGLADDAGGGTVGSAQYIKTFPFEPKTFVIDVISTEYHKNEDGTLVTQDGGGWWESVVKDPKQLEEVWQHYDRKTSK